MDTPALRKSRGAFFTPLAVTEFLTKWAVRGPSDHVLEPSCGDAAFLIPAAKMLQERGASTEAIAAQLQGFDIHPASLVQASERLAESGHAATLRASDFFDVAANGQYDAVVGNPPFVRYQSFSGDARLKALKAALAQGVRLTGLASSWAAFAVHAIGHLKPGGRLALVLPAELLTVGYAAQVRDFLMRRFSAVRLVVFEQLVFEDALEEVVLLLAEGIGGATHFKVYQAKNAADLANVDMGGWTEFEPKQSDKWTSALLSTQAMALYDASLSTPHFERLASWGSAYLGAVTGNNAYFTLSQTDAVAAGLQAKDLRSISPPGSRHLRGLTISKAAWESLCREDARACMFYPSGKNPSVAAARYIKQGELDGVDQAYKCQVRSPWWQVPLVETPDLFFTYMNHDRPRLTTNDAGLEILNSLYGIKLNVGRKTLGRDLLPVASLNSLTVLGAEVVGRSYGGGLLKHEPREADKLPLPSLLTVQAIEDKLRNLRPLLTKALRGNKIDDAVCMVDKVLLKDHMGLDDGQIECLRQARTMLFERRKTRARGERGED